MNKIFITNYGRLNKKSKIFSSFEEAVGTKCRYIEEFRDNSYHTTYEYITIPGGYRYEDINDE